jgi:hypothetical protein
MLFEPGSAGALASIMRRLAQGEVHLENFTAAAQDVADRHTVARMVDAYAEHYTALLHSREARLAA